MNFRYKIKHLKLFGYHGVYKKEKKDGQYFLIDVSFDSKYNEGFDDNIDEVIDYNCVCNDIAHVFENRCDLIETLISNIKKHLETKYTGYIFDVHITKEFCLLEHVVKSISVKNI